MDYTPPLEEEWRGVFPFIVLKFKLKAMIGYCNLRTRSNDSILVKVQLMGQQDGNTISLDRYIDEFLLDIQLGKRVTNRGTKFSAGTIASFKQTINKFMQFEQAKQKFLDFEDIDLKFYREYNSFLIAQNYSLNSIGKCIKNLKQIILSAEEEGFYINPHIKSKSFKVHQVAVDSIYLTKEDLKAISNVDLSSHPLCYTYARDIFLIGVWTAQRVSDYNNLKKQNIKIETIRTYDRDGNISERTLKTIRLVQQKTRKRVTIPCSSELCKILDKYPDEFPHLYDQQINIIIRQIGLMAGLNELMEITSTKGGKVTLHRIPKWKLIQTHTARRTGATLMYLSGMDVYDICKITGHSSVKTLERYIKATELETVRKITQEYDYFK